MGLSVFTAALSAAAGSALLSSAEAGSTWAITAGALGLLAAVLTATENALGAKQRAEENRQARAMFIALRTSYFRLRDLPGKDPAAAAAKLEEIEQRHDVVEAEAIPLAGWADRRMSTLHAARKSERRKSETPGRPEKTTMRESRHQCGPLPYLLFTPECEPPAEERWPTIVFLHGRGESSADPAPPNALEKLRTNGLVRLAACGGLPQVSGRPFPFLVAAPQAEAYWKPHTDAGHIIDLVDELVDKHGADPKRCYLTGISMGGFAVWENAARFPDRFAALVPMSASVPAEAAQTGEAPAWVFAGGRDKYYPLAEIESEVAALREAGREIRLTVEQTAGHDDRFWNESYAGRDLYEWLLEQRRD